MIRRRALRLSFSDRAPRIKSANLSTPTTIGAAWVPNFLLRQRRPDRLQLVRLDDVALLEVVEVLQADAALEALVDFLHVVLETAQRGDAAGEDRLRVAQQPYERGPRDIAVGYRRPGDGPELGLVEERLHLGMAEDRLLDDGLEQAFHGELHLVEGLVDDRVVLDLHAFLLGGLLRIRLALGVEPDDERLRGGPEHDVALRDVPDAGVDDVHRHLGRGEPRERVLQRLDRPL